MKTWKRMIPVICLAVVMLLASLYAYTKMMAQEQSRCYYELSSTAQGACKDITTKISDEIAKLHLLGKLMAADDGSGGQGVYALHLDMIQPTTIFSRIDLLYPDDTLVSNGKPVATEQEVVFSAYYREEEYITGRMTDFMSGEACVYYVLPVMKGEAPVALLIGVLEAGKMAEFFQPTTYSGLANICVIDSRDGNYLVDTWHDTLGNIKEFGSRKTLKSFESIDFVEEVQTLQTGLVAFESRTTGEALYMYYTPLGMFDWQLAVFAGEDALFENVHQMRRVFTVVGLAEVLLLAAYGAWNIRVVKQLEKSNREIEAQREQLRRLSYQDSLTDISNRTKYEEMLRTLQGKPLENVGAVYMDLNGLKQINDADSHHAGDRYIRKAACILSEIFGQDAYRIGGDEFVAVSLGLSEEEFEQNCARLKSQTEAAQVSVSLGTAWQRQCGDLNALLEVAEAQMYQQKKAYYRIHDRRR